MIGRNAVRLLVVTYVGLLVGLPVGSIVYKALELGLSAFWSELTAPAAAHALVLTLEVTAVAVALNTLFGLAAALLLTRHRFAGSALVETLIDLPLSISPVVAGLALLLCYSSTQGLLGPFLERHGVQIIFSFPAIVMASAFVSVPYVVREVQSVLTEIGTDQEEAASTLGARPFTVFWRVTLPSIRWGLSYGVLLTTARVLGEFGAVAVVSGAVLGKTQTLTLYIDYEATNLASSGAYAGALVVIVLCVIALVALNLSRSRERAVS